MCGIVGIIGTKEVATEIVQALTLLQHRGQDAAGIVTFSAHFHCKKRKGLIPQVISNTDMQALKGKIGIGHVRYATQGGLDLINSQPFYLNFPFGIAMVHNGNVHNSQELAQSICQAKGRIIESENDLELLLYSLTSNLIAQNKQEYTPQDYFSAVEKLYSQAEGAYSVIAIIAGQGMLAFTDPLGIRPLILGKRITPQETFYAFASESSALECLDYEIVQEFLPGEAIFITQDGKIHSHKVPGVGNFCVFEYIYFAREDSIFQQKLVATARKELGAALAKSLREKNLTPDLVTDVPSSAWYAAAGLAQKLDIPYEKVFVKNKYSGRSFIQPSPAERTNSVRFKLNPIRELVVGKKIAVVDDSIVRGTTSLRIANLLKAAGAKEIYLLSAAPPIISPCIYGIDISISDELISGKYNPEELATYLGVNAVIFQDIKNFTNIFKDIGLCTSCFTGEYPTNISAQVISQLAKDRLNNQASSGQQAGEKPNAAK